VQFFHFDYYFLKLLLQITLYIRIHINKKSI